MNALEQQVEEQIDAVELVARGVTNCARCGRTLTDPVSVKRGLGPVCYGLSGGGIFDGNMDVPDEEWARRERLIVAGGEVDFGVNWRYPVEGIGVGYTMRVSVRFHEGRFETYGHVNRYGHPDGDDEVVFVRTTDLKEAYQAAIEAGPRYTAMAHRAQVQAARAAARQSRVLELFRASKEVTDDVRSRVHGRRAM